MYDVNIVSSFHSLRTFAKTDKSNVAVARLFFKLSMDALHNVYFVQYDVPVSFLAQVLDTGTYFFSLYILRILAFYAPNLVYDTGSYFGGNHGSRV